MEQPIKRKGLTKRRIMARLEISDQGSHALRGQTHKDARDPDSVGHRPGSSFLDKFPFELSGGQQQRVFNAPARAVRPALLIVAESTRFESRIRKPMKRVSWPAPP